MPRSAKRRVATSSMCSRMSKSSTDGRRPRGFADRGGEFIAKRLIDELVKFKEGFCRGGGEEGGKSLAELPDGFDVCVGANLFVFRHQRRSELAGSRHDHPVGGGFVEFARQGNRPCGNL